MKSEEVISYVSIAVIAISLFFIGTELTGFVTTYNDTAEVNVTIDASAGISFSTAILDFGSGAVTPGHSAVLDSNAGTGTYWSGSNTSSQLVLENIGNVNLTLQLKTNNTATQFIGGTNPLVQAKVTNKSEEPGACTGTNAFDDYAEINTTLQTACGGAFAYETAYDQIDINFKLTIPSNALGTRTTLITAVGTDA